MEECLHMYFIENDEIRSSCDFNSERFEAGNYVYEVIRVVNGKPLFLKDHIKRFYESFSFNELDSPVNNNQLRHSIKTLISINKIDTGNIKIIALNRKANQALWFAAWFIPCYYPSHEMYLQGVDVALFDMQRPNPNAKIQRQDYKQLILSQISKLNVFELLLLHNGTITEGSRSNIFFIEDKYVVTAPESTVLKGITRDKVFNVCFEKGLLLKEKEILVDQLPYYQSAFLTGTSPKVLPIRQIAGFPPFSTKNVLIDSISAGYENMIRLDQKSFVWE